MRISGLVRMARAAEARLRAGVPVAEQDAFLSNVRQRLGQVHGLLVDHGASPDALPAPSRAALASLTRIAAMTVAEVAGSEAEPGRPVPVRVRNVVSSLRACEDMLSRGSATADQVQRAWDVARAASEGVWEACERAGSTPAGLPARSRTAYSMLRWLAEGEQVRLYAAQVDEALRGLAAGLPEAERQSHRPVEVVFAPGRLLYRVARRPGGLAWRISAGFLTAGHQEFRDLATRARYRERMPRESRERHESFTRSESFTRVPLELEWLVDPQPFRAKGRTHDLRALFEELDRRLLQGRIERPHLHWWSSLSRRTFGFHHPARDLVCINTILDDPSIPAFVAEVVLYHECLHKLHPPRMGAGRRIVHTQAFRAAEREHPRYAESEEWLARLAE